MYLKKAGVDWSAAFTVPVVLHECLYFRGADWSAGRSDLIAVVLSECLSTFFVYYLLVLKWC